MKTTLRWALGLSVMVTLWALQSLWAPDGAWYAMPPLVAAVALAAASMAGVAATVVFAGLTVGNLIMIASLVYGVVSARNARRRAEADAKASYNASLMERTTTFNTADCPLQIIYGEPWVQPVQVTAVLTSGDKDQFKHVVVVWAHHECEAIGDITLNGQLVGPLNADGWVTAGKFRTGAGDSNSVQIQPDANGRLTLPFETEQVQVVTLGETVMDLAQMDKARNWLTFSAAQKASWEAVGSPAVWVSWNFTTFTSRLRIRHHLGGPGQVADAALLAECPGDWSASDIGEGICYSIITYDLNLQEFQGGPMTPRARIKGKKLYDPRTGQTQWGRNNALATLDYIRSPMGKGALATQVDEASFAAGATVCADAVDFTFLTGVDSAGDPITAPRYAIDGVVRTNVNPDQVLDQLCQSMAATLTRTGGLWTLQPGTYSAPVMTLGDADCCGAIEAVAGEEGHQVVNGMRGQFYDPARYGELTDYRSFQNAAYRAEDGEDLWGDLSLPFTFDHWRCSHLASIHTERSRVETLVFPAKRRALRLRAGQRVVLSNSQLMINAQVYRVLKKEWRLGGPVMLTLQQDAPEIWDIYPALSPLPPTSTPSDDPWVVAPVQNLQLSSGTATLVRLADGTVLGRIRLSYAPAASALVVASGELQVETRRANSSTDAWLRHPSASGSSTEHFLLGLEEGVVYLVRARWVNGLGARSDWATAAVEHVGKLQHPAAFGTLTATVIPGAVRVLRTPEPEVDWAYSTFEYTLNGGATWLPIRDPAGRDGVSWLNPPVGTVQVRGWDVDSSGLRGNPLATDPFVVAASDLYPSSSTLGIKANVQDFAGNQNWSEAYIHGITGGVAVDAAGSILVNGVARSVPAGVLYTNRGPVDAWIVWDMAGVFDFSPLGVGVTRPYAMCRRTASGWQYDNNGSGWVPFTPSASHVVIGSISTGGPDANAAPGITSATMFAAALTMAAVPVSAVDLAATMAGVNLLWGAQNGPYVAGPGQYGGTVFLLKTATSNPLGLRPGETLTLSADMVRDATAAADGARAQLFVWAARSNGIWTMSVTAMTEALTLTRVSGTATLPSTEADMDGVAIGIFHQGGLTNTTGTVRAERVQLERGSVASLYSPGAEPGATVGAPAGTMVGSLPAEDVESQSGAAAKAAAAQAAAQAYAAAQAELAETTAKAYADGQVDAEEARAIADATAKAEAARLAAISAAAVDATAKANVAATTAVWGGVSNRPRAFKVTAWGLSCTRPASAELRNAETNDVWVGAGPMYRVATIHRITLAVTDYGAFNTLAGTSNSAAMAAVLNAISGDYIVVVWSYDEPQGNRMASGLAEAMYRHGASQVVYGSPNFRFRSAYILVGLAGCGEGNGAECYAGAVNNDPNAWCELSFSIQQGALVVSGTTSGARTLADYGYTGSLDATRNYTYYQNDDPGGINGETWLQPSTGKSFVKVGGSWVATVGYGSVGTQELAPGSTTVVTVSFLPGPVSDFNDI